MKIQRELKSFDVEMREARDLWLEGQINPAGLVLGFAAVSARSNLEKAWADACLRALHQMVMDDVRPNTPRQDS